MISAWGSSVYLKIRKCKEGGLLMQIGENNYIVLFCGSGVNLLPSNEKR